MPFPSRDAFDSCPNKTLRKFEQEDPDAKFIQKIQSTNTVEVVCPQYPFGSNEVATIENRDLQFDGRRDRLAKQLGCATCRFKDEVFVRNDTQSVSADGTIIVETTFSPEPPTPAT